ncbi:hypothetical protein ACFQ7B_42390 [Streptomyces erythrochromogenes]|uniref:hypothetical protein n=1 Tax=Streptomyces erythrochromogenes TaxID=285574 RepID=UPI0036BE2D6C
MRELAVTAPRRLVAGGSLWTSLVQIFIVNNLIALPRASDHNPVAEAISALGLTRCALVEGTRFCSPWHEAAAVAWIAGGVCLGRDRCSPQRRSRRTDGATWSSVR